MAGSGFTKAMQALQKGTYGAGGEILDYAFYDSFTSLSTTLVHELFTRTPGVGGATLDQVNMPAPGQIPNGQHFAVYAIKAFYTSHAAMATATIQLLYTALTRTTVEFIIPNKDSLLTVPLTEILGISTLLAATPTAAGDNIPLIQPRYHGVYPLNVPIVLASQTNFRVRVTHQAAPAAGLDGDIVRISLQGVLRRLS